MAGLPPRCGCFVVVDRRRKYIPLLEVKAHTTIVANSSRTTLTQTFENPDTKEPLEELSYVFPLYDGVSVVKFMCTVGNRVIHGVVKEKAKAKQDYDDAKKRGLAAGLLEQTIDAADVFRTKIGNVPAGETVQVDIEYLGELKHDAEADALRFTIPTRIAPRYGSSETLSWFTRVTHPKKGGFSVTVDADMPKGSAITSIQSPSHPISIRIGHSSTASSCDIPSLERASASLALGSAELDKDFVVQVTATQLGEPSAVLEVHPTIPNQRALMTTLVPRFDLPADKPEIVFVCDRSGSMGSGDKIHNLTAALNIFLRSLPVGVKFNICSFGTHHSFLWDRSQTYDQTTLDTAVAYVKKIEANYGGTQMYEPMSETFERRYKDMNLEVFLITDGDIWQQDRLFGLINDRVSASDGAIRVFTLGVGRDASHALIEGVARAGNGFSQSVGDNEQMSKKVVRMLKASLMPHVRDYTLEVKYDPAEGSDEDEYGLIDKVTDALDLGVWEEAVETPKQTISLFNPRSKDDDLEVTDGSSADSKYGHLPQIEVPRYLQTPFQIPPLFPLNRTNVYVMLPDDTFNRTPTSVLLRATSAHGPLELEIPVTEFREQGETIHQLAARKAVKELEEGRGWIFHAKNRGSTGLLKNEFDGRFPDMVEREAVRLGIKYQIAGKWCSFVAAEDKEQDNAVQDEHVGLADPRIDSLELDLSFDMASEDESPPRPKRKMARSTVSKRVAMPMERRTLASKAFRKSAPGPREYIHVDAEVDEDAEEEDEDHPGGTGADPQPSSGDEQGRTKFLKSNTDSDEGSSPTSPRFSPASPPKSPSNAVYSPTSQEANDDPLQTLASLQSFSGSWSWSALLEETLGVDEAAAGGAGKSVGLEQADGDVLATACVVAYLQKKLTEERDTWVMILEKAVSWLHDQVGREQYEELAKTVWGLV